MGFMKYLTPQNLALFSHVTGQKVPALKTYALAHHQNNAPSLFYHLPATRSAMQPLWCMADWRGADAVHDQEARNEA